MESNIGQAPTTFDNRLFQFCGAFDDELRQRINDSGDFSSLDTEEKFLLRLKDLTITKIYRSVHLMNLCRMTCNYVFIF